MSVTIKDKDKEQEQGNGAFEYFLDDLAIYFAYRYHWVAMGQDRTGRKQDRRSTVFLAYI